MAMVTTALAAMLLVQDAPSQAESGGEAVQETPATAPVPPCATRDFRAFDFWIGEWTVTSNGAEEPLAHSRIESVAHGCAIRETWMPFRGGGGTSTTAYDTVTGIWHQTWIGAQPGEVDFYGGIVDGAMVLTGYWGRASSGQPNLVRMTYTLRDDGSVRQYGQTSTDHGLTWSDSFDLTYRPRAQ